MALVTREEVKQYLRVDSKDEDQLIDSFLSTAEQLCIDVARITTDQWEAVDSGDNLDQKVYNVEEVKQVRELMKIAILYTVGYLYEHREEADHHDLVLTLRSLLFSIREGVVA